MVSRLHIKCKHRWPRSFTCRLYIIRRARVCAYLCDSAAEHGHQADRQVGPRDMRGPAPPRALAPVRHVPRQVQHLEPRVSGPRRELRGVRAAARALGQVRRQEELDRHGLRRQADPGVRPQDHGAAALARGARRLHQVRRGASDAASGSQLWR